MSQRKMFTESDLVAALSAAGTKCRRKVFVYLIGGCAMTFMGRKVATKDIDVVLSSAAEAKNFTEAMKLVGFAYVKKPPSEYDALLSSNGTDPGGAADGQILVSRRDATGNVFVRTNDSTGTSTNRSFYLMVF